MLCNLLLSWLNYWRFTIFTFNNVSIGKACLLKLKLSIKMAKKSQILYMCSSKYPTVAHKYNTSIICTCCSTELRFFYAEHFSPLPSISRLYRVFFLLCQAFFSYAEHLSALPRVFLLFWRFFCSVKHFSSVLSTSQLFRALFWPR